MLNLPVIRFVEREALAGGEVEVRRPRRTQLVIHAALVAEGEVAGNREAGFIEPAVHTALRRAANLLVASGDDDRTDGARTEVVAQRVARGGEGQRQTAVEGGDAVHAPSTDGRVYECVACAQVLLPVTEGQIDAVVDDKVMRQVLHADGLLRMQIVVILHDALSALSILEAAGVLRVAQQLGLRVRDLHEPAMLEAPIEGRLQRLVGRAAVARYGLVDTGVLRERLQQIALEDRRSTKLPACGNLSKKRIGDRLEQTSAKSGGAADRVVLIGKLIEIQARACVALREHEVRTLRSGVGDRRRGLAVEGALRAEVPLLHIAVGLIGDA